MPTSLNSGDRVFGNMGYVPTTEQACLKEPTWCASWHEKSRGHREYFRVKIGDGRSEWDADFEHGFWRTLRAVSGPVAAGRPKTVVYETLDTGGCIRLAGVPDRHFRACG